MKEINWQPTIETADGKIYCRRCQAMSKRTRMQCGAPAERVNEFVDSTAAYLLDLKLKPAKPVNVRP